MFSNYRGSKFSFNGGDHEVYLKSRVRAYREKLPSKLKIELKYLVDKTVSIGTKVLPKPTPMRLAMAGVVFYCLIPFNKAGNVGELGSTASSTEIYQKQFSKNSSSKIILKTNSHNDGCFGTTKRLEELTSQALSKQH